jgi:hypothetical protein
MEAHHNGVERFHAQDKSPLRMPLFCGMKPKFETSSFRGELSSSVDISFPSIIVFVLAISCAELFAISAGGANRIWISRRQ